jgi:hypothetical protein
MPGVRAMSALILPRRLAIALLAEAQRAAGAAVSGVITAREGVPATVVPDPADVASDEVWARYRSGAEGPDAKPGRQLLISIDTKGVLQLRCWEDAAERELRII